MERKNDLKILDWAKEDRPREKLLSKGKATLSNAELIGILIGSGTKSLSAVDIAKIILKDVGNDINQLAKLDVNDLRKFRGIGEARAITIVSALELGRRRRKTESAERPKIRCSQDAYDLIRPDLLDQPNEFFWIILMNRANSVIKKHTISTGGLSGTVADPKMIFKAALENRASAVILVHNHPSGNLQPSQADILLTKKLKDAGKVMEIPILDHIIFTDESYFSFADEGML
ncbi:DNA repair protein RadC [Fulvivirgaceae bacterium BMA10]|uniref:DNA repair protein RadC n=1 Tax=Splendidivirga corallicola TaxID=3051826 RepID=A0ABT8KJA0_9BACT|nr:DNA repair protein RadC [Fulvivirgaceae bacterium BMA10]